jgi:hypothetical protein
MAWLFIGFVAVLIVLIAALSIVNVNVDNDVDDFAGWGV